MHCNIGENHTIFCSNVGHTKYCYKAKTNSEWMTAKEQDMLYYMTQKFYSN